MNRQQRDTACIPEYQLEETSQQWALSNSSIQDFLALEVDLVVLFRELTKLADMSSRIAQDIRKVRLHSQDTRDMVD